jgi:2-amino-4-hydroxy-6-hydroxymethyldihydropteridine diphosphokinase
VSIAYLSLGSNLGNRRQFIADAILALNQAAGVRVSRLSQVYETEPVGVVDQPKFLNLVVEIATTLSPRQVLALCLMVEARLGRVRMERWGPRTIDIDVLWYEGAAIAEADLTLPHPRMLERAFVLVPLSEIAPELSFAGVTVRERASHLDQNGLRVLGTLESVAK